MGRAGRYNDEISHTRPRAADSSRPHGSPLHTAKPSSSVQAAAGGESSRASARGRLRHPEGGPGKARMKTRVITLLLAAGLLAVAALTALSIPAAAQTQTVYVELADGSVVPVTVDVPPGTSLDDIQLPGTPVPAPPAPETTAPTTPTAPTRSEAAADRQAGAGPAGRRRAELRRRLAAGAVGLRRRGSPQARRQLASSSARPGVELRMRSRARSAAAAARRSATPTARRRRATPASSTCCPAPPPPPGSPTSSSASSACRPSCFRSTRPPASSTACAGRSSRPSTRSRRTTAAT